MRLSEGSEFRDYGYRQYIGYIHGFRSFGFQGFTGFCSHNSSCEQARRSQSTGQLYVGDQGKSMGSGAI